MGSPERLLERLRWALWVAILLTTPVTSFPHFPLPQALGEALVRPLSLYPLAALLMLEFFKPGLTRHRPARMLGPLLAFVASAVASTALAFLDPPLPLRNQTALSRALRGVVTLAAGVAFLLVTSKMASNQHRLRSSIRWLCLGLSIDVAWGLLQGSRLVFRWPHYAPLNAVQRLVSIWDMHEYRVTGFAYEPSWFADQMAVLYLPLLAASLLSGVRIMVQRRMGWLVEAGLLAGAFLCLTLTYSRGGVLVLMVSWVLGLGTSAVLMRGEIWAWIRRTLGPASRGPRRRIVLILKGLVVLGAVLGVVVLIGALGARNEYFALLWRNLERVRSLPSYFLSLGASTRYALTSAAWGVFQDHPLLGVGLGQSGFYLFDRLPDWALDRNPEMAFLLLPTSWTFPNPKNLWVRLLAETGLVGALFFAVFLVLCALGSIALLSQQQPVYRLAGLYGMLAVPAVFVSGFSLDSLALPTMWMALGLVVSAVEGCKRECQGGA